MAGGAEYFLDATGGLARDRDSTVAGQDGGAAVSEPQGGIARGVAGAAKEDLVAILEPCASLAVVELERCVATSR